MGVLATGSYTIIDFNDVNISTTMPTNPVLNQIWVDISKNPYELKVWNGNQWVTTQIMSPDDFKAWKQIVDDNIKTVIDMGSDKKITKVEKIKLAQELANLIGYLLGINDSMPTLAAIDTNKKGLVYSIRQEAKSVGLTNTDISFSQYETAYTNLSNYLNTLTPKVWDVSGNSTDILFTTWTDKWIGYYEAYAKMRERISKKIKDDQDSIAIGVTNQLLNSAFLRGLDKWSNWGICDREVKDVNGRKFVRLSKNDTQLQRGINQDNIPMLPNTDYTVSFLGYKATNTSGNAYMLIHQKGDGNIDPQVSNTFVLDTTPKRYSFTFKSSSTDNVFNFMIGGEQSKAFDIYITEIKLERGNKMSDWSPAPQDLEERITNVEFAIQPDQIVSAVRSSQGYIADIKNLQDQVTTTSNDSKALGVRVSSAEQKITDNAIISTVTNSTKYTTDMSGKADTNNVLTKEQIKSLTTSNLIRNTEFLIDTAKWTFDTGWSLDTTKRYESANTMKVDVSGLTTDGNRSLYSEFVPCAEGEKFVGSTYIFTDNLTTDTDSRGWNIEIEWFNATGTKITSFVQSAKPTTINTWERKVVFAIAPAGTTKTRLRITNVKNGRFWVSRLMLAKGTQDSGYIPHIEDLATDLKAQLAINQGKIDLVVSSDNKIKGDQLVTSINLQPSNLKIASKNIDITGAVTFSSFDSAMQTRVTNVESVTTTENNTTVIDGGRIKTGSVSADKIKTNELEVGTNIRMGPNATIDWTKVNGKPNTTKIDQNGIYTGTITFDQASGGKIRLGKGYGNGLLEVFADIKNNGQQELVAEVNENGASFPNLNSQNIKGNVVNTISNAITYYVDGQLGRDSNIGTSKEQALKTVREALNRLPKYLAANVEIVMVSGIPQFHEDVWINGFIGNGSITFKADLKTFVLFGHLEVKNCSAKVFFENMSVYTTSDWNESVYIDNCQWVECRGIIVYTANRTLSGFGVKGSRAFFYQCDVWDAKNEALYAARSSICDVDMGGGGRQPISITSDASFVTCNNSLFGYTAVGRRSYRYGTVNGVDTNSNSSSSQPSGQSTSTTTEWQSNYGGNWSDKYNSWEDYYVKQGDWGYGNRLGIWTFGDLRSILARKTIDKAEILITRLGSGGYSSAKEIQIRSHPYTNSISGRPDLSSDYTSTYLSWNDSYWIDITDFLRNKIANGLDQGFGVSLANKGSDNYVVLSSVAKLRVTYR